MAAPTRFPRTTSAQELVARDAASRTAPGAALVGEANDLIFERQWAASVKVLEAAKRLRPNDLAVDELLAVASAHAGKRRFRDEAIQRLSSANERATNWTAIAAAQLAQNNFADADRSARRAIDLDENAVGAWNAMAASFAGLGWFDEASDCLDRALAAESHELAPADETTPATAGLNPLEHWQLGRAINNWGMATSRTLLLAVVAVLLFRLLGAALVISAPLILREYRVSRLDPRFREIADDVWRRDHRPRIFRGLAVLAVVSCWLALILVAT